VTEPPDASFRVISAAAVNENPNAVRGASRLRFIPGNRAVRRGTGTGAPVHAHSATSITVRNGLTSPATSETYRIRNGKITW
jgi:hypothetical protein